MAGLYSLSSDHPPNSSKAFSALFFAHPSVLAEELVANLVKFEEVSFGRNGFLKGPGIARALLKALSTVGEDSKLRILSIPGFENDEDHPDALAEARKMLTVDMLGLDIWLMSEEIVLDDVEDEEVDEVASEDENEKQQPTLSPKRTRSGALF